MNFAGITMKKIMIRPCEVTKTLYVWLSWKIWTPGYINSMRIRDRHDAADDARDDREDEVHRADVLMARRIYVTPPPRRIRMIVVGVIVVWLRLLPCPRSLK